MSTLVGGEWSDSRSDRSVPGDKNPSRLVSGLEALEKGEIFGPCREFKDDLPVSLPIA